MTGMGLRPLRISDTFRVLEMFTSAGDMTRQGRVTNPSEAEACVTRLLDPDTSHLPFATAGGGGLLFGLVVLSVDSGDRNAQFWYWTHLATRGRGWMGRVAVTIANWTLISDGLRRLELDHRLSNPTSQGVALAIGLVQEGLERKKFPIDGQRIDVVTCRRLASDPTP